QAPKLPVSPLSLDWFCLAPSGSWWPNGCRPARPEVPMWPRCASRGWCRRLPLSLLSRWTRCPRWPARAERGGEWPDGRGRAFGLRPFTAGPATVGGATGGIEAQAFARATAVLAVPVALAVTAPTARAAGSPAAPGRCCPGRGHRCQLGRFDRRLRLGESAGRAAGG